MQEQNEENEKPFDVMILSGGFDPVHIGHLKMFNHAKELANIVIVGVNSDAWLTRKKGKPFMKFEERQAIVAAFKSVDRAWGFNDDDGTACDLIKNVARLCVSTKTKGPLKVAFGNGGDRNNENEVPSAEAQFCKEIGVSLVWGVGGTTKDNSSSKLLKEFSENKND